MNKQKCFFAAANGYSGFRSYFDSLFKSDDYNKIYVLKGGPGTGKSSLMKKLSLALSEKGVSTEHILCSSDPKSLDGVIFKKNGIKTAILDGTAPHERDAIVTGAIDEIIDLGANLDKSWLVTQRGEILELTKEKKNAYNTAYSYLNIAGIANKKSTEASKSAYDIKLSNMLIKSLAEHSQAIKSLNKSTRLISSFGKDGKLSLETESLDYSHSYSIVGEKEFALQFLSELYERESENHSSVVRFPSPFDNSKTEAVLFPDEGIFFSVFIGGEEINTSDFVSENSLDKEKTKAMKNIEGEALIEAQRWFAIASDFHFRLEEIYSKCMNFSKNNTIFENKFNELCNLFEV